jgi:23S rRNA pseudouridine1911/1915/1917 synthase
MRKTITEPTTLIQILETLVAGSSRTTLRQILASDRVRVNGALQRNAKTALIAGDVVDVSGKAIPRLLPPELSILFEDDHLIVVDKADGLLTVATEKEKERTAQAFLNAYLKAKGRAGERIHVVHRIDRDTSGALVFAKSFPVREALKDTFAAHEIDRLYIAIVEGEMRDDKGTFESWLREDDTFTVRSVQSEVNAKHAVTHFETIKRGTRYSYLHVTLETGRKNQIRVHMSEAGHPIVGDERYGATTNPLKRLGLHAYKLGFKHPVTGQPVSFTSPVPDVFKSLEL